MAEATNRPADAPPRRFRPYREYRDSGVEWLGEIPAHWQRLALGLVTISRCDGPFGSGLKSEHYSESGIRVVRLQNIGWAEFTDLDAAYLDEAYARQLGDHSVKGEDLLIAGLGDDGHPVGRACVAPAEIEPAMVKADCFRFRLDRQRVLPRYAAFQLSAAAAAVAGCYATGATRARMNLAISTSRKIALPPLKEQEAIADFLDRETAKIDALVARKERLIELLQEKRTALITRAVTRGLNPDVPKKDSGVEWLGEIPAHWETLALGRVTISRCDGPFGSGLKSEHYSESGIRVVRLQNIGWAEFINSDTAYLNEAYARRLGDHGVKEDDILIAGLGDDGHPVGRACVAPVGIEPAMVKADCFRFRLDRQMVLPRYAAFQLSATAPAVAGSNATGATRTRMNLAASARRKIALPPLKEQQVIAIFLDRETAKVDALAVKIHQAIDQLREFRTALISTAVTGKIDVRRRAVTSCDIEL